MLSRLLSRGSRREENQAIDEPQVVAPPKIRADSLLLFVPVEGGMAYQLFAADSEDEAIAFLHQEFPRLGGKPILFQPLLGSARNGDDQAEVLVVINDPERPGVVYLSSFTDMESAKSFAKFEERNGLDPSLVTLHTGVPRTIEAAARAPSPLETPPVQPRPASQAAPTYSGTRSVPRPVAPPVQAVTPPPPLAPAPPPVAPAPPHVTPAVTNVHVPAAVPPATRAPQRATLQPRAAHAGVSAPLQQPAVAKGPGLLDSIRQWPGWDTLSYRVRSALTFKWQIYEDIEKDTIATSQARVIVATAAAAGGIGALWAGPVAVVIYAIAGILGFLAGAFVTYWVGTFVFPGRTDIERKNLLFTSIAICQAPRALLILGIAIPVLYPLIVLGVLIWSLAATVPATEYSLEIDRESAILTAISGWVALFAISFVIPALII
jgi:hypothetical protein